MPRGAKPLDVTGERYGRLAMLRRVGIEEHKAMWLAACACGTECVVMLSAVRQGRVSSCGCLRRETVHSIGKANARHGMTDTPTWRSWKSMNERCSNPRLRGWAYWGGSGISVCVRWRTFEHFLSDMGERPPGTCIDRIDNDGNYEPGNCRWASVSQSNQNKRPGGRRRKP